MRPVLMDPAATGPDPVYMVHRDLDNGWENKTELVAGLYSKEFPKTFGHTHADNKDEIYHIESGEGLLLLESATDFYLIKAVAGDEVKIPKEFAHCWVNIGSVPLVSYDDHKDPKDDYESVKHEHGLAYYVVSDNGSPQIIPNPNHPVHPQPKWLTAQEFKNLSE